MRRLISHVYLLLEQISLDFVQRKAHVFIGTEARAKICRCVTISVQNPFAGEEALNPNRAAGVDAARADPNFSPKAEPVAVREAGGSVVKDAGRIDAFEEFSGRFF